MFWLYEFKKDPFYKFVISKCGELGLLFVRDEFLAIRNIFLELLYDLIIISHWFHFVWRIHNYTMLTVFANVLSKVNSFAKWIIQAQQSILCLPVWTYISAGQFNILFCCVFICRTNGALNSKHFKCKSHNLDGKVSNN